MKWTGTVSFNGEIVAPELYAFDEEQQEFKSNQDSLVIDIGLDSDVWFETGPYCSFNTGPNCTIDCGDGCTFKCYHECEIKTGDDASMSLSHSCDVTCKNNCVISAGPDCTFVLGDNCTVVTWGTGTIINFVGKNCIWVSHIEGETKIIQLPPGNRKRK